MAATVSCTSRPFGAPVQDIGSTHEPGESGFLRTGDLEVIALGKGVGAQKKNPSWPPTAVVTSPDEILRRPELVEGLL